MDVVYGERDCKWRVGRNGVVDADEKRHAVRDARKRNHHGITEARVAVASEIDRRRSALRNDINKVIGVGVHVGTPGQDTVTINGQDARCPSPAIPNGQDARCPSAAARHCLKSSTFEHTMLYLSAFAPSSKSDDKRDVIHGTFHAQIRIGLSTADYLSGVPFRVKKERRRRLT